jgi:hypothetical protein
MRHQTLLSNWSPHLWWVIGLYLALAVSYSLAIPLGEGPDEPGHAAYVFFLGREGRLPVQGASKAESDVPGEGHQPPLAYLLAAPVTLWLPREARQFDLPGNPRFVWAGGSEINAVAHGSREFWPWSAEVLAWRLARLVSVALGVITLIATYRAACALPHATNTQGIVAALLVACHPQFLFTSALVTNDALLTALAAILLWLVVRQHTWQLHTDTRPTLLLGIVFGLALITKQSALLFGPVVALALIGRNRQTVGAVVRRWGIAFGAAGVISGWWFARNWWLYGDPLGLAIFRAEFTTQPFDPTNLQAWIMAFDQLHASFWARFGWMNVAAPDWVIWCYGILALAALFGLTRQGIGHWALVLVPALSLVWIVSFALTAGLVGWQGRLLFPALPAIAVLLARGLQAFVPGRALTRTWVGLTAIGVLVGLAVWLPFGIIRPAYPFFTVSEATARRQFQQEVYAKFGRPDDPGAELLSWKASDPAYIGKTFELTLIWHARGRQNRDWTVFVHLVDGRDEIVAERNMQPLDGAFPMTQWVAGDWLIDQHVLAIPTTIAPGRYTVRVGLFDPNWGGRRAGRFDQQDRLQGDALDLGQIEIRKER